MHDGILMLVGSKGKIGSGELGLAIFRGFYKVDVTQLITNGD